VSWFQILGNLLDPSVFIYLVMGVITGMITGSLPGLTATMSVAIITPLTLWLSPEQGFAMLIGVFNSAIWAGGISAILLNTPGTPASIATTFDGYPLVKMGKGKLALGINVVYSVIGGLFGTVVLMTLAWPLSKFALKFGPPEYFTLAIFGISIMVSVSEKSMVKGLMVGFLGLLLSTIGLDPMRATPRFTFGNVNLMVGISFIPALIGLFGIGEILYQVYNKDKTKKTIVEDNNSKESGRLLVNFAEFVRLIPVTIVSSIISVVVGAIPGAGGDIASIICWDRAKKMSKKPEEFEHGSIEGLAATCVSNNAVLGGAMTTTMTLGIPGDSVNAVLIGSFMMYGVQPGPRMFIEHIDFVKSTMLLMFLAYLLILVFGLIFAQISSNVLKLKQEYIWTTVTLLCIVGSYSLNNAYLDVWIMFIAGMLGFIFKMTDYPLGPLILGLLLGGLAESNLARSLSLSGGDMSVFFTRPISLGLILITTLSLVVPLIKKWREN
jgi:putative tricarboxylic transport membrane protein